MKVNFRQRMVSLAISPHSNDKEMQTLAVENFGNFKNSTVQIVLLAEVCLGR